MIERIAEITVKWLAIFLVFAGIGYALRMHHEQGLKEYGREVVMRDIAREWDAQNVFHICSEDNWCLKLIPRKDDKSLNINVVEERI